MAAPFPELRGFATEEENPEFELSFSGQPLEPSVPPPATAALGSLSQIKTSRSRECFAVGPSAVCFLSIDPPSEVTADNYVIMKCDREGVYLGSVSEELEGMI
eukprot:1347354-Amorphochlora_amoeboformis.AAC.1